MWLCIHMLLSHDDDVSVEGFACGWPLDDATVVDVDVSVEGFACGWALDDATVSDVAAARSPSADDRRRPLHKQERVAIISLHLCVHQLHCNNYNTRFCLICPLFQSPPRGHGARGSIPHIFRHELHIWHCPQLFVMFSCYKHCLSRLLD